MNLLLLDLPERIETPRLLLQVPKAGDGKEVHRAICDGYKDYVKWLCWPETKPNVLAVEADCRKQHADFILRKELRYLVIEKSSGKVIGRAAYPAVLANWLIPMFGISYFVSKSARGQGYAKELANALTRHAFEKLGCKKIEIKVDVKNIASLKVPQALNFTLEAKQRGNWPSSDISSLAEIYTYAMFDPIDLPELKVSYSN